MYCEYCGKETEDDSLVCVHCGKSLSVNNEENLQLSCGNCGENIKEGEDFCGECGKRVIRGRSKSANQNSEIIKALFKKIELSTPYRIILGIILAIAILLSILSVLG